MIKGLDSTRRPTMSKNKQFGADADMLIWPKSDAIT